MKKLQQVILKVDKSEVMTRQGESSPSTVNGPKRKWSIQYSMWGIRYEAGTGVRRFTESAPNLLPAYEQSPTVYEEFNRIYAETELRKEKRKVTISDDSKVCSFTYVLSTSSLLDQEPSL